MTRISVPSGTKYWLKRQGHQDQTGFEPVNSLITVIGFPETSVTTNQHCITFQQPEDLIYTDAIA
jgi:hypothetical protein